MDQAYDTLSEKERICFETRYFKRCNKPVGTKDVLFAYPPTEFKQDPLQTCERLQKAFDFLVSLNLCQNPTIAFEQRVIVGYRDTKEDLNCVPGWNIHWINVPWNWLTVKETEPFEVEIAHQPEFLCSHELVHPFEHLFLSTQPENKKWKEAFCDSLRVFTLREMGYASYAMQWKSAILCAKGTKGDNYHAAAGRLYAWLQAEIGDDTDMNAPALQDALRRLIASSMDALLDPHHKIKFS